LPILKDFGDRKYGAETSQKERTEMGQIDVFSARVLAAQ
jgi:hypothetical protein